MASKRAVKRAQCNGKQKYEKEIAIRVATKMRKRHIGQSFDAYQCEVCGGWHVGHRPYKVRQAMNARKEARRKSA